MTTLTVTARGQVRAELAAEKPAGSWRELQGFLEGKTNGAKLSIEDIAEAGAAAGASGLVRE